MANFVISIDDFLGGLAPGFWESDYPSYGNKNMAGKAQAIDLTDPSGIKPGPGKVLLTNGGAFAVPIRYLNEIAEPGSTSKTYGIGNDKLFQITHNYDTEETTVVSGATFPRTISGATGEDVCLYQGKLYYSYNTSASGVLGQFDLGTAFNDTFKTDLTKGVCHRMIRGGNDFLYIANGNLVASYDGTTNTWTKDDLDLPDNHEIWDMIWLDNWLYILTYHPKGITNRKQKIKSSIFVWDANSPSWSEEYKFEELLTAFYFLNGVFYVFGQFADRSYLGIFVGRRIEPLFFFPEDAPRWYQITNYKGCLIWAAGDKIYAYGSIDNRVPMSFFPIITATSEYTINTLASPFGFPIFNENSGTTYKNQKTSGYETSAYWKSLLIDISGNDRQGMIDEMRIDFDKLVPGNSLIINFVNNKGETIWTKTISYASDGAITSKFLTPSVKAENFRIELDWSNNSTTAPFKVKKINIQGHTLK
jgi:hypothetical protein